jgi:ATPase subunit of ABC transporter with duplicated ATPase domains
MTLLRIHNLGITLSTPLFSNLNLIVKPYDRVGLVAANGRGKSSLFQCIMGILEATEGEITRMRGLKIGYVEQYIPSGLQDLSFYDSVLGAMPAEQAQIESWRVDVILEELNVPQEFRLRKLSALSGGWQRLAMIARVWVSQPDLLILDEPTNHLDLGKIGVLENWIHALPKKIPIIIASHDRAFLDAVTNRTFFLRPNQSQVFDLPYSRAKVALDEGDAADAKLYEQDMKVAGQLRKQAAKLNNIGINSGSDLLLTKTKQLKERALKLENSAKPAHLERSAGLIKLANAGTHAKVLITLNNLDIRTPAGDLLLNTGKKLIFQGDRIALLGRNGVGKSTFINMLRMSIQTPEINRDAVKVTPSLVLGYSDQAMVGLGNENTPMDLIRKRFDITDPKARSLLASSGISIDMQSQAIYRLSGGQKARLAMLVLRLTNPNFYLLDEPTNHLDIEGQEALENELMMHNVSGVVVSHDRSFVRHVANRFWEIENMKLIEVESPEKFLTNQAGYP